MITMGRKLLSLGVLFVLDFLVSLIILLTDRNLRTDFGTITHGYFLHWYGMLAISIISIIGGIISFSNGSKKVATAGAIGSLLILLFLFADVLTAPTLGLTYSYFASYLFGFPPFFSASGYIPGLYDILVVLYLLTTIMGFRSRSAAAKQNT
ncbi:MAG: hypothetical protein QXV22_05240 [Thermoplasmataceae archaeon]